VAKKNSVNARPDAVHEGTNTVHEVLRDQRLKAGQGALRAQTEVGEKKDVIPAKEITTYNSVRTYCAARVKPNLRSNDS